MRRLCLLLKEWALPRFLALSRCEALCDGLFQVQKGLFLCFDLINHIKAVHISNRSVVLVELWIFRPIQYILTLIYLHSYQIASRPPTPFRLDGSKRSFFKVPSTETNRQSYDVDSEGLEVSSYLLDCWHHPVCCLKPEGKDMIHLLA